MLRHLLTVLLLLVLTASALASEARPVTTGPVLTADLPKDAVLVGNQEGESGYTEQLTTSDGLANIVLLRRSGSVPTDDLLKELYPVAKNVKADEQYVIASYPAVLVTFSLGANEDSRAGVLVVFWTDTDTFAFAADATLDSYEGDKDYQGLFETWIESLNVFGTEEETKGTLPEGLQLTCALPENTELDMEIMENGDYTNSYLIDDSMATVLMAHREEATDASAFLKELYPEVKDAKAVEQLPIASYPAERLTFTIGDNEDTRRCVLVAISTDSGSFAFAAEVPSDFFADYQQTVEAWISSLDLIDG